MPVDVRARAALFEKLSPTSPTFTAPQPPTQKVFAVRRNVPAIWERAFQRQAEGSPPQPLTKDLAETRAQLCFIGEEDGGEKENRLEGSRQAKGKQKAKQSDKPPCLGPLPHEESTAEEEADWFWSAPSPVYSLTYFQDLPLGYSAGQTSGDRSSGRRRSSLRNTGFTIYDENLELKDTMVSRTSEHAEESAEVEVLLAQAKKHDDLGKKIKACLGRIQDSGTSLQAAVGPVYNDTQKLQVVNNNVDKLLAALARMQTPLEGKADEERVIRDGPGSVGVPKYLASLRRVEGKYRQLNNTPMRMNQEAATELSQLLQYGARKLQELFDGKVRENNKPVEPLSFLAKEEPFPRLNKAQTSELNELNGFISSTQPSAGTSLPTLQVYAEVRGKYLAGTLQNMATASVSTSKRKNTEEMYRRGQNTIPDYAQGIEGAFVAEWDNICAVFLPDQRGIAFELTTAKPLAEYSRTLNEMRSQIKEHMTTDCFLAYEILEITSRLALQMDSLTGQLKQQILDAAKPVRDTAKQSLTELLEDVRRRISGLMSLPNDGAPIGFTTEVMKRLQSMTEFRSPLASVMTSLGDGNWKPGAAASAAKSARPLDVGPDRDALLAHYVLDTLDALFSALENRARSVYKQKSLLGIFIANNVAVADRMVRTSDLGQLLAAAANNATSQGAQPLPNKIETWRKKGTAAYLESWREPCAALMETQYTNRPRPASGSNQVDSAAIVKALSGKDRDAIKEKFKSFNVLFESLSQKHRELAPSMERDVRAQTAKEIAALIEPLYGRFWDRYHEVDKGKGKYVKWDKPGLSGQLASLG